MTPSPSGTRSRPNHQPRPPAARRYRQTANSESALKVTFCVRGVISPLLANLFLHYAFDAWMSRNYPHIPFERYADDAICHCKNAEEAQALWSALQIALRPASWCCTLRRRRSSTEGCEPPWRLPEPVVRLSRVYVPSEESVGGGRSALCVLPARRSESVDVHQPNRSALDTLSSQRQVPAGPGRDVQPVGLTRFGGHPEAFVRGAADAKNTPSIFAGISPTDGRAGPCWP